MLFLRFNSTANTVSHRQLTDLLQQQKTKHAFPLLFYKFKMQIQTQQIDEQLAKLINQEIIQILDDASTDNTRQDESYTISNVYFDKQLTHLVVSQQFNFANISKILTLIFQYDKIDTSEAACRERWTYLYKNRDKTSILKQKQKENKRAKSVAAFSNPYSLYNIDELIENLEQAQKNKVQKGQILEQANNSGYNILKDNFRKISNIEQYNELQSKMKQALEKAKQDVYQDKPMLFTPHYQKLQEFEVKGEELTAQKVKQLMAYQIQIQKVSKELAIKKQEQEQQKYQSVIRKRVQKQHKIQKISQSKQRGDIDQDWDQYQSD